MSFSSNLTVSTSNRFEFGTDCIIGSDLFFTPFHHQIRKFNEININFYKYYFAIIVGYLPNDVLWRQKEQFSDGVGYEWIDKIKLYAASHVSDESYGQRKTLFPHNTPSTKEAFYYRNLFSEMFPGETFAKTVMKWVPRTDWGCPEDPSGRAQSIHIAANVSDPRAG